MLICCGIKYIFIYMNGVPLTYWYTDTEQHSTIARSSSSFVFFLSSFRRSEKWTYMGTFVRCVYTHEVLFFLFFTAVNLHLFVSLVFLSFVLHYDHFYLRLSFAEWNSLNFSLRLLLSMEKWRYLHAECRYSI